MTRYRRLPISLGCALIASIASLGVSAQTIRANNAKRPSLVVGIVVDGLDIDRVYQLRDFFGSNGFNRLLNQGVTITDLEYGSHLDETAATAVIYTGAAPAVNGIPSSEVFDVTSRRSVSVLNSPNTIGNFTDETYSPAAVRVSTLADELRIDTGGLGDVYALSPEAEQAIIMAGHAGNNGSWINPNTGKWASTTFYTELPTSIQQLNHLRPLSARLDTLQWAPTLPPEAFSYLPSYKKIYSFRHTFPHSEPTRYEAFRHSAPVNAELTSISADYIKMLNLGKGEPTDMLNVNYTLHPYTYGRDADNRTELIDSYLRLDRELDRLFRAIDASGPGMGNTMVFVAGTPINPENQRDDEKWRVPTGDFSPVRAVSLLKVNLMSIYGNGDWVTGYHNGQFFLNRELIRERGKDLDEFRRESADFLRRMSGVTRAATIDEVISAPDTADSPFPPARNIDIENAGDVFIAVAPGWCITNNSQNTAPIVVRTAGSTSAAFILYPPVEAQTITTPVDARAIAPTVARLLRIRAPNGSQVPPIRF